MKKGYNDLVTDADFAVNTYLERELKNLLPNAGWLSEETADNRKRLKKKYVWVVDPIDGTYQFAKRKSEWTISVALVDTKTKQPNLGIIYHPLFDDIFYAEQKKGAFKNGIKLPIGDYSKGKKLKVLSTTRSNRNMFFLMKDGLVKQHKIKRLGSIAYILALTAACSSDAFITYKQVNEWDIAAGTVIIKEAGGFISDRNRKISFNNENLVYHGIFGYSATYPEFENIIRRKY